MTLPIAATGRDAALAAERELGLFFDDDEGVALGTRGPSLKMSAMNSAPRARIWCTFHTVVCVLSCSLLDNFKHSFLHCVDYILLAFHLPLDPVNLVVQEFKLV